MWEKLPPAYREIKISRSSFENLDFGHLGCRIGGGSWCVSALPLAVLPTRISPLGVVPKPNSDKRRLIINVGYINEHIVKIVFEFKDLLDVADMTDKGDYSVSYDLASGYYHVSLHPDSRCFVGFNWKGVYCQ